MSAVTSITRSDTSLVFREQTERWLLVTLASISAVLYLFVIPLEFALHARADQQAAAPTQPVRGK